MLVRLNCFRDGAGPGDVVDVDDWEVAGLIAHGTGVLVDGPKAAGDAAPTGRVVKGAAVLEATSEAGHTSP